MPKCFCTILLVCCCLFVKAQLPDYHLQYFDYSSGIRPGNIEGLHKDKEGFIWIVYPRSVQRFDGQQVRDFKPGKVVVNLHCDRKGRLWLSVQGGVQKFNTAKQRFEPLPVQSTGVLPNREVFELPDGSIWLATSDGFYRYDEMQHQFQLQPDLLPLPPPYSVRSFAVMGYSLFLSRKGKTLRYNVQTKQLDSLPYLSPRKIYPMTEDSVLITSWNINSYWLNFKQHTVYTAAPPELGDRPFGVRSLAPIDSSNYLLASQQGMFSYNALTKQFKSLVIFNKGEQVNSVDFINHLYSDGDGYVWAASIDGVARFPAKGQLFGLIRIAQQSNNYPAGVNNIRGIVEDDKGNLWMATGNGFVHWNRHQNKMEVHLPKDNATDQPSHPSIRGIGMDGPYLILAPADRGVWLYNTQTKQFRRPAYASPYVKQLSEQDFFDGLTSLRNGNHVLNGRDALYQLKGKTYVLDTIDCPAGKENTNFSYQGKDGWVWVTTTRGLHLFDEHMHYLQKVKLPGDPQNPSAGFIMKDNTLLLATDSAVQTIRYEAGRISIRKFASALDGIFFTNLFVENKNILWATSDAGIYRYDPKRNRLNLFDYTDNVQGYGFNINSWQLGVDGMLYLGGINGLNYLQPDHFFDNLQPSPVKISELRLGNDSSIFEAASLIQVPWKARNLSVSFVSPWYNNTAKLHYRYKLNGIDANWHYVGNVQELRFADLEPGNYTLLIESSLNKADWTAMTQPLLFDILPPFWRTWWFVITSIVLLVLLSWWLVNMRMRRLQLKQEEMEAEQAIHYFSSSKHYGQSVDDILWGMTRNCIGRLGFNNCVVYLLDEEKKQLLQKAVYTAGIDSSKQQLLPMEIALDDGIAGAVAERGKPMILENSSTKWASEMAIPIVADGKTLGVIQCSHSKKRFFTQRHITILSTIASLCAGKITRARAEAEKQRAEQTLMATQQQLADIEMQALRAQMNPHFIFNCLNSINRYIVKSDQATASLYLTRFAKLIRLILDNSNNKSVSLSNELEALRLYIEMETIRFEKQFTYSIKVAPGIDTEAVQVPPMIIQPFVENAIWHGLLHKETPGHLSVEICCKNEHVLECSIHDNGVGREKAKELKSKSASTRKSLGMKITEDRLSLLNKQAMLSATITVEDLFETDGDAAGTLVILKIPVDQ
jgi:ligand-binding sensor domain-containing protein